MYDFSIAYRRFRKHVYLINFYCLTGTLINFSNIAIDSTSLAKILNCIMKEQHWILDDEASSRGHKSNQCCGATP